LNQFEGSKSWGIDPRKALRTERRLGGSLECKLRKNGQLGISRRESWLSFSILPSTLEKMGISGSGKPMAI